MNKAYEKPPMCERNANSEVQFWSEHRWQNQTETNIQGQVGMIRDSLTLSWFLHV